MKLLPEEHDLLNDCKLDEMQKAYAYKVAFKCFKALYWSNFAFTVIPLYEIREKFTIISKEHPKYYLFLKKVYLFLCDYLQ